MSFRKLAKDAFGAARDRYHQYEQDRQQRQSATSHTSQQFPGQQSHNQHHGAQPYATQASQSAFGQGPNYPAQQSPFAQGPNYPVHQYWGEQPPVQLPPMPHNTYPGGQYTGNQPYAYSSNVNQQAPTQQPPYPAPQSPFTPETRLHPPTDAAVVAPSIDIFAPITTKEIPIPSCDEHPVSRRCIYNPARGAPPSQTNAFYGNWLLGEQGCSIWTHPYSLSWSKGQGNARSWGIAISHIDREQLAFGEPTSTGGSRYYINPVGIQSIIISAKEVGERSVLTLNALQAFSATALLCPAASMPAALTFPLLQGMGFVTALTDGCTPLIQSSVFFREVQTAGILNHGDTTKYRIILEDGKTWLLYVTVQVTGSQVPTFVKVNNTTIEGPVNFRGTIQVAKLPPGCSEEFYDRSAGAYAFECQISARVNGSQGTYTMTWNKAGSANPLIMYALSHHVTAFTRTTAPHVTPMRLQTTTKGMAVGVLADNWQVTQQLPTDISFTPWLPSKRVPLRLSPAAAAAVVEAAKSEVEQDVIGQCNLDSMYFSGKGLGKFAMMAIALHDMASDNPLAFRVLEKLKQAFAIFVNNQQRTPLVYEKSWRGVVSRAGMENAGADFGNGYYNDHHFHYGYFVYAAAVIGYLDPAWLQQGKNRAWVNMLVRDFANPVNDEDFPFFRSFDWFHGHSWAKGLFESGDGKDEESTSEDSFASYALKMWGKVSGNANLEARGNLMLAVQAQVFQTYFLMEENNTAQPRQVVPNKVTGITFENKVDHATYFGMNTEYIQGIHMIPLAPPSTLVRTPNFVREEWETYFSGGRANKAGGGWRGILYANLAIIDPKRAYEFFSRKDFDWGWLDGGASRTWLLAWCAGLGGA